MVAVLVVITMSVTLLLVVVGLVVESRSPYRLRMATQAHVQRHAVRRSREVAEVRFEVHREATRLWHELDGCFDEDDDA